MNPKDLQSKNKFYVTTPIYYINDVPHIGHAYSTIAADVLARYYRQKLGKEKVFFLTGTDENSKKTVEAANKKQQNVKDYTDETAQVWQEIWNKLGIEYDRFIRTTEPDHIKAVQDLVQKIYDNGDVYKGKYEGLYCFKCEAFYKPDEVENNTCPVHKTELEFIEEENYFFKLSKYQQKIKQYILKNPEFIQPETRRNEVLAFIDRGLEDISISRDKQEWGIRLPFDQSQMVYVWFDALINYLSGIGYPDESYVDFWPADVHIVGKDIIKFHCIIWPAMLLSAGLELPKKVFAHGFFTLDGEKISKSSGNAVDPVELAKKYGNDALRYYLLREITFGSDGDFSHARFKSVYESDLANNLGNLVSRVAAMLKKYNAGKLEDVQWKNQFDYSEDIESLKFHVCLGELFAIFDRLNEELEKNKPWERVKSDPKSAITFLSEAASELVFRAKQLEPFLPETANKIQDIFANGKVNDTTEVLFPRIEDDAS